MKLSLNWTPLFDSKIPDDVQVLIINYLCYADLDNCFSVSKTFYQSLRGFALLSSLNVTPVHNYLDYGKIVLYFPVMNMITIEYQHFYNRFFTFEIFD